MNDIKRIVIVLIGSTVLCLCAFGLKGYAEDKGYETQVNYITATQVSEKDRFNYAVDSRQGRILTNGNFTATSNLAKFDEMTKGYTYVKRSKEHYTMHTQTYQCGKSTCIRIYYSWDFVGDDYRSASTVNYFGRNYNSAIFNFDNFLQDIDTCVITNKSKNDGLFSEKHGCINGWSGSYYYIDNNDRYYYHIVPTNFNATFLTTTYDGTLRPVHQNSIVLENKSIKQLLDDVSSYKFVAFVVFIISLFTLIIVATAIAYQWVMSDGKLSLKE